MGDRFILRDSGEREQFTTGSRRDTREGKGRYDLMSPLAMRRLALVYEKGAAKYGERNMELGQPLSRFVDSALRHIMAVVEGKTDEDHAAQAAWNLLTLVHTQEAIARGILPGSLDDLPDFNDREGDLDDLREIAGDDDGGFDDNVAAREAGVAIPAEVDAWARATGTLAVGGVVEPRAVVGSIMRACCAGHVPFCAQRREKCCDDCITNRAA